MHFVVEQRPASLEDLAEQRFHDVGQLRGEDVAQASAEVLVGKQAVEFGHGLVDAHEAQVRIKEEEADWGGGVELVQFRGLPGDRLDSVLALSLIHVGLPDFEDAAIGGELGQPVRRAAGSTLRFAPGRLCESVRASYEGY